MLFCHPLPSTLLPSRSGESGAGRKSSPSTLARSGGGGDDPPRMLGLGVRKWLLLMIFGGFHEHHNGISRTSRAVLKKGIASTQHTKKRACVCAFDALSFWNFILLRNACTQINVLNHIIIQLPGVRVLANFRINHECSQTLFTEFSTVTFSITP